MKFERICRSIFFLLAGASACLSCLSSTATPGNRPAFSVMEVGVRSCPEPGKILVSVDIMGTADDESASRFNLKARLKGDYARDGLSAIHDTTAGMREEMVLDAADLPEGDYSVKVDLLIAGEVFESTTADFYWPGRCDKFKDIRILNNFVWELLDIDIPVEEDGSGEYIFTLPYDRWLFIRSKSKQFDDGLASVYLRTGGKDITLYSHTGTAPKTLESMRRASAGEHSIRVSVEAGGGIEFLQVRAVPEIRHHRYPSPQHGDPGADYNDWEWLEEHILPNVNTMITSGDPDRIIDKVEQWRARGGKWLARSSRPGVYGRPDLEETAEIIVGHYRKLPGYAHPLMDGLLADEFQLSGLEDPSVDRYVKAVRALNADPDMKGKSFNLYMGGSFGKCPASIELMRVVIEGGGRPARNAYIYSHRTLPTALNAKRLIPYDHVIPQGDKLPGLIRNTIWVFTAFSYPRPSVDGYAHVNYNAYLDMQFRYLATNPALFGLGGVSAWRAGYMDEELLRQFGRMYRHYCIEGNTERLMDAPYLLTHISNPDFSDGTDGWTLQKAFEDSMKQSALPDLGGRRFRYHDGPDTFLLMTRSQENPNVASQEITGLEKGELYSVKFFTGDMGAMMKGISEKKEHPVSISIEGAKLLEGPRYGYILPFATTGNFLNFSREHPFWLNYRWQVFRAEGSEAVLRISDWENPLSPGAPEVKELFCTYVEVKPFVDQN